MKCDYKGCTNEATVSGFVYGHIRGVVNTDGFHPVKACDFHKNENGFFEKEVKKSERNRA